MGKIKARILGSVVLILFLSGLFRFAIKPIIFLFVRQTNFADRMASMVAMLILTSLLFGLSKKTRICWENRRKINERYL